VARAEKAPMLPELLDRTGRNRLLTDLREHAEVMQAHLALADQYTEIVTIAGLLQNDQLDSAQRHHLQKMAALESKRVPVDYKDPNAREFWEIVRESTGSEWETAQNLSPDFSDLPRDWQGAFNDLVKLSAHLRDEN
jgi:formamidopyrimidine-DNA glycosylase